MLSLLFLGLMYFLPTIIGRDKSDAGLIFLVNLLLGWTVVGWIGRPGRTPGALGTPGPGTPGPGTPGVEVPVPPTEGEG